MDIDHALVLIQNQDMTKRVFTWKYEDGEIVVSFHDGSSASYGRSQVLFYRDPTEINIRDMTVIKNGQSMSNVTRVQNFGPYVRIIYKSGNVEAVPANAIRFARSGLDTSDASNRFAYLKEIAYVVSSYDKDGLGILGTRYNKINHAQKESVLSVFLRGSLSGEPEAEAGRPLYPFGYDEKQRQAVERALTERLSVIEGPTGTGKTQTVLNVIANAMARGKTVAVVSCKPAGSLTVLERLEQVRLGFSAACFCDQEGKEGFLSGQDVELPPVESWLLGESERAKLTEKLCAVENKLDGLSQARAELASVQRRLDAIRLEYRHFLRYYFERGGGESEAQELRGCNEAGILALWKQSEQNLLHRQSFTLAQKSQNFLRFGVRGGELYKLPPERLIMLCQRAWYEVTVQGLYDRAASLAKRLADEELDFLLKEQAALSMRLVKSDIARRFLLVGKRERYKADDLYDKPYRFMRDYPVVLSTAYHLRGSLAESYLYDYLIVDDASQVDLATGALALSCAKHAVLVGDPDMPANRMSDEAKRKTDQVFSRFSLPEAYRFSSHNLLTAALELFENMSRVVLDGHYRCQTRIADFINQKYYGGRMNILTSPRLSIRPFEHIVRDHRQNAEVIQEEIEKGLELNPNKADVSVVVLRGEDAKALERFFFGTTVKTGTVSDYQGKEKDTVFLCVGKGEGARFDDDPYSLCAAVSRAVGRLILVTDETENRFGEHLRDLIRYIGYSNVADTGANTYAVFETLLRHGAAQAALPDEGKKIALQRELEIILRSKNASRYAVARDLPLRMLLRPEPSGERIGGKERELLCDPALRLDFVIYERYGKTPLAALIGDRAEREALGGLLEKYGIALIPFAAEKAHDREGLAAKLAGVLGSGERVFE